MTLYGSISLIALVALLALLAIHFTVSVARRQLLVEPRRRLRIPERVLYLVLLGSVFFLAGTAFFSVWVEGHMRGWSLLIHLLAAGGFATALPLAAALWAGAHRMGPATGPARGGLRFSPLARLSFWLLLLSGGISMATMLASMVDGFSTEEITLLISIHRYSGLIAAAAALTHFYALLIGRARIA